MYEKKRFMTLFNDYILVIPSIRAQSTLIHGTIGKSTHLRCSATAPFDTTLYWRRIDNNNVSSQPARFRQQQHIHGDLLHTTLYIKDLEKEDFGLYGSTRINVNIKPNRHAQMACFNRRFIRN